MKLDNAKALKFLVDQKLSNDEFRLACTILANRKQETAECSPDQKYLAIKCGKSQQQISRLNSKLKAKGIYQTIRSIKRSHDWFLFPNQYFFLCDFDTVTAMTQNGGVPDHVKADYDAVTEKLKHRANLQAKT